MYPAQGHAKKASNALYARIPFLLVVGLLLLRFPFYGGMKYFFGEAPEWVAVSFQIGTYFLTACLIWWERDHLADFLIDKWALAIFVLGIPLETIAWRIQMGEDAALSFPNPPTLVLWAIAISLLVALRLGHCTLPPAPPRVPRWMIIGVLTGIGISMVYAILLAPTITKEDFDPSLIALYGQPWLSVLAALAPQCLLSFIQLFGFAAISEEPLFRGFLWGYLRRMGWTEVKTWFFVASLFWLGHLYYVGRAPLVFWIEIPLAALIFGLLAWKSRSIATSMMAHSTVNGITNAIAYWVAFSRL
jgi:membrane protease YdiL (CAAX protease family)